MLNISLWCAARTRPVIDSSCEIFLTECVHVLTVTVVPAQFEQSLRNSKNFFCLHNANKGRRNLTESHSKCVGALPSADLSQIFPEMLIRPTLKSQKIPNHKRGMAESPAIFFCSYWSRLRAAKILICNFFSQLIFDTHTHTHAHTHRTPFSSHMQRHTHAWRKEFQTEIPAP